MKMSKLAVTGFAAACMLCSGAALAEKPLSKTVDLSGAHLTVGSKEFTEQEILGKITVDLLKAAGADVKDETGLAGSNAVRKALLSGKIDMYWEYTGTAWLSYLGHTGVKGASHIYKKVAAQDLKKNKINWLKPADFSDSYGIVTNQKTAKAYNLKNLSDLGKLIKNHPDEATLCVGNEFYQRDDGLKAMEKAYGWKFPSDNISVLDDSLVYQQTAQGERCNFGSVFTTDGRIKNLKLVLLKDNKSFFPPYYASLNVRHAVLKKYPGIAKLIEPVSKALTTEEMQSLNAEVDVNGKFPEQVAHEFLVSHNFIPK